MTSDGTAGHGCLLRPQSKVAAFIMHLQKPGAGSPGISGITCAACSAIGWFRSTHGAVRTLFPRHAGKFSCWNDRGPYPDRPHPKGAFPLIWIKTFPCTPC